MGGYSKIILLGHTGFIGTRLAGVLRERHPSMPLEGRSYPDYDLAAPGAERELESLFHPDAAVVFLSGIKRQFGDDTDIFSRNVQMALNVGRALKQRPVRRLVFFSSAAVYGEDIHNTAITEDTPVCPTSYYGMAKYISERVLWKVFQETGQGSWVFLRPPTVYGPGDPGRTYGPAGFIHAALSGEPITLWGDGEELRDFIFLDDLAGLVAQLLDSACEGVLNTATGHSVTFRQMLDSLAEQWGRPLDIRTRPRTKQKVDNVFVVDRLRTALPGLRFTPLADGIGRVLAAAQAAR